MSDPCNYQHWIYLLNCDEYEQVYRSQDGRCGVCRIPEEETTVKQLTVDHEHAGPTGYWAVRGLLCGPCNGALRSRPCREMTSAEDDYLRNAWWLSLPPVMNEPPIGTVLRGRWSGQWERLPTYWLDPKKSRCEWRHVVWSAGPHLRLLRDTEGRTHDAPRLVRPRRLATECLSRRQSAYEERLARGGYGPQNPKRLAHEAQAELGYHPDDPDLHREAS